MTASGPLFPLGRTVATPGVLRALSEAGDDLAEFFARHERGDWGEVDEEHRKQNNMALRIGARVLSIYRTSLGVRFYVITEEDQSVTTALLPEDY